MISDCPEALAAPGLAVKDNPNPLPCRFLQQVQGPSYGEGQTPGLLRKGDMEQIDGFTWQLHCKWG